MNFKDSQTGTLAEPPFLTVHQAADYLRIACSTLYKLTSMHEIGFYQPGGKKLYFLKADLDKFILRRRVPSRDELGKVAEEKAAALGRVRR